MPVFAIHCIDHPDGLPKRQEHLAAHRAYAEEQSHVTVIMSGPLKSDDGEKMIGSLFLVDAPDRAAAERFQTDDPFYLVDLWESRNIQRFDKRVG